MTYTEAYKEALNKYPEASFISIDGEGDEWIVRVYERDSRHDYDLIAKYKVAKYENAFTGNQS